MSSPNTDPVEYEVMSAAKWQARQGYSGRDGEPLPDLLSARAHAWINNNRHAFREMIHNLRIVRLMGGNP